MASLVNLSLEEIIRKKKGKLRGEKVIPFNGKNPKASLQMGAKSKVAIGDARNKIILKKRTQIVDAREKLTEIAKQRDARLKLTQLREKRVGVKPNFPFNKKKMNQNPPKDIAYRRMAFNHVESGFHDLTRQVRSQPRNNQFKAPKLSAKHILEHRTMNNRHLDAMPRIKPIRRTVNNDVIVLQDDGIELEDEEDDPMGEDYPPRPSGSSGRKASLNLKIIARNNDTRSSTALQRRNNRRELEREKSPPRLQSILKKRPMVSARIEKVEVPETPLEYRIIVSNLRNTVTGVDIQELFGDIGGMVESRLVRPGTAEVIYKSQEAAQRAVDLYHNRQLDGQAMNCLLVVPRPQAAVAAAAPQTKSNGKPTLPPSTNSNVEPDLSTFHKVMFNSF